MSSSTDRSSNRPEKTVYSITSKGKKAFQLLLSEALDLDYRPTFPLDADLYFSTCLSPASIKSALSARIERMKERLGTLAKHQTERLQSVPQEFRKAASLIFSHHEHHYQAELEWATKALAALSSAQSRRNRNHR